MFAVHTGVRLFIFVLAFLSVETPSVFKRPVEFERRAQTTFRKIPFEARLGVLARSVCENSHNNDESFNIIVSDATWVFATHELRRSMAARGEKRARRGRREGALARERMAAERASHPEVAFRFA